MTEAEWMSATVIGHSLSFLRDRATDRKKRLFVCGCCRAVWDEKWPRRCRQVVEVAERFADGLATELELDRAHSQARQSAQNVVEVRLRSRVGQEDWRFEGRLFFAADAARRGDPPVRDRFDLFRNDDEMRTVGRSLLHCVFGNPFRPIAVESPWLTSDAVALATAIYLDRAFDRLPVLADALEDAGCENADVLNHLRSAGPHVRGCWPLDLVLGKS